MIVFGSAGKRIELGPAEMRQCPVCGQSRLMQAYVDYRYVHLYWIFRAVTKRVYLRLCACGNGILLDRRDEETKFGGDPIPFTDRFGLPIFLGAAGLAIWLALHHS